MIDYDKQLWEQNIKQIEKGFKDHRARLLVLPDPEISANSITKINWKEPGTVINWITYLIYFNRLIVIGDMGEAVFVWAEMVDLKFLRKLDYSYFTSKRQGLGGHEPTRTWDPRKIEARMKEWLGVEGNTDDEDGVDQWVNNTGSHQEWSAFVHECPPLNNEEAYDWGYTFDYHAMAIFHGLKMAADALDKQAVDTSTGLASEPRA